MTPLPGGRPARTPAGSAFAATATALLLVHLSLAVGDLPWGDGARSPAIDVRLRLNPNAASAEELALLPRIGPRLAANIVAYRESALRQPAFRHLEDLDHVTRIGPATLAAMEPYLRFPRDPPSATPAPESP